MRFTHFDKGANYVTQRNRTFWTEGFILSDHDRLCHHCINMPRRVEDGFKKCPGHGGDFVPKEYRLFLTSKSIEYISVPPDAHVDNT